MRSKFCLIPLCCGFTIFLSNAADATTGSQYVAKRMRLHCDRKLAYSKVQSDPVAFVGKVLELKGSVTGLAGAVGETGLIMLTLSDKSSVSIDAPPEDIARIRDDGAMQIRALVEVKDNSQVGNVVAIKTIAVATEVEVSGEESRLAAKQDVISRESERKRKEDERWRRVAERSVRVRNSNAQVNPAQPTGFNPIGNTAGLPPRAQSLYAPYYNYVAKANRRLTSDLVAQITFNLLKFSDKYNVDPRLVVAMVVAESDFDPMSTSHSGAVGLGQLMPETSREFGLTNPYDPAQNLAGSIVHLRGFLDQFGCRLPTGGVYPDDPLRLSMAAYNAGAGAVKKYHGVPPYKETQGYVKRVLGLYHDFCQQ